MSTETYAAIWSDTQGRLAGSVSLGSGALHLDGAAAGREARRRIPYRDIASVHMGRNGEARLVGRPSVVLELRTVEPDLRIAMTQPGALHEFLQFLTERTSEKGARS
jgi:hypothetical protein